MEEQIKNLEKKVLDLNEENERLLKENDLLQEELVFCKDKITDREARIIELEKGMEEALADLQYVL